MEYHENEVHSIFPDFDVLLAVTPLSENAVKQFNGLVGLLSLELKEIGAELFGLVDENDHDQAFFVEVIRRDFQVEIPDRPHDR